MAKEPIVLIEETELQREKVGYCKPPASTRFKKGQSGNPKGRPRNRRREIPYDALLGQMVTVREGGKERRITAAEAFILLLTKKDLDGDNASNRASLAAIEKARAVRNAAGGGLTAIRIHRRIFGLCGVVEDLGMAVRLHPTDEERVRLMLKPWIIEAALARFTSRRLSIEEQKTVTASTRTPEKVSWPGWWEVNAKRKDS